MNRDAHDVGYAKTFHDVGRCENILIIQFT